MDVDTIKWIVKNRLTSRSHEGEMKKLWITILGWVYPATEGFAIGSEMYMGGKKAVDIVASHLVKTTKINELNFLVVEAKAAKYKTQDAIWDEAYKELKKYLSYISQGKARRDKRLFGIIGVGRVLKIYEWQAGSSSPVLVSGGGGPLYIDRQCATVTMWLKFIRDNHA